MKTTKGIVAAGNTATAKAARIALEAGGNAFDAAVAAALAAFVAEPCMCSPGGGGFMTAINRDRNPILLDFFVQTPAHKPNPEDLDFFPITVDFGTAQEIFYVGRGSAGVPGMMAGILDIHAQFCRLPLKDLAEPAIQFAKTGVRVDAFQAWDFHLLSEILKLDPISRALFFPDGNLIEEGKTLAIPALADFLSVVVAEGRDFIYRGEIAAMTCQPDRGSALQRTDFESYQATFRKPLALPYRNHWIIGNPPPAIGSGLIGYGLERLWPESIPTYRPNSREHLSSLIHALSNMDRLHQHAPMLYTELARLSGGNFRSAGNALGGTTHLSVMDEWGNAVALSASNGEGNGQMIPGTGFMMNNMLGETALLPNGLHSWEPGARLSSMMAPTVVTDEHMLPLLALGTGGAGRIPGAILQVLHYVLDLGLSPEAAVQAPRVHWHHNTLNLEEGWPENHFPGRQESVVHWGADMFFGGVHSVGLFKGQFIGAGDPRRCGVVEVVG